MLANRYPDPRTEDGRAIRRFLILFVLLGLLVSGLATFATNHAEGKTVRVRTVEVGSPGNPSVGIVPFTDAIYPSCAEAPAGTDDCQTIGSVGYRYGIGQLEITTRQWVKFLNTADPDGRNRHRLYDPAHSSSGWPEYGAVNKRKQARSGRHYSLASAAWADKPYSFATFLSAARLVNSLDNGKLIWKRTSNRDGFRHINYKVRLSSVTERGMYDLRKKNATRSSKRGFVVPSQDEWTKAAYFDPAGGGTYSYWKYPTNEGVFGDGDATAPTPSELTYDSGAVDNGSAVPLATFHQSGLPAPEWCPAAAQTSEGCSTANPFGLSPTAYGDVYQGNLSSVGGTRSPSPWGTLDQGGNAVEWTDTITPPPFGLEGKGRVWRRLHGGVSNAPAFQMWPSAVGLQPQDNFFYAKTYPWLGIRVGVIGKLKVDG